jgi:hypothetical protein
MNQYVTFQRVVELLQTFQEQSPILNSFGFGNLVDFSRTVSANTVNYPYMFVVPLSINYDENITEYQFSIIFADLLNYDLSNEVGCVSDMSLQAKRFMSYLKRGIQTFPELYNNMDIVLPTGAIPFMERFGDHTAGVALDCVLQVFEDLNACDFYDPTPTITPTNTPTPTFTPTNTPTTTLTPTITPSSACVRTRMEATAGGGGAVFTYQRCNGTIQTTSAGEGGAITLCLKTGGATLDSGVGTITELEPC